MKRLVCVLLVVSMAACFPHNARNRRIAKWSEGGAIAGGIAMLAITGTGADCTAGPAGRGAYDDCRRNATITGDLGLGLILAGLVGFGITQITSPDETAPPPAAIMTSARAPMGDAASLVPLENGSRLRSKSRPAEAPVKPHVDPAH